MMDRNQREQMEKGLIKAALGATKTTAKAKRKEAKYFFNKGS
jgi:hypothetical protein